MLRHLSIRDFVIVDVLDLDFDPGFTVFSGETGAGKSILIDALALALGARGDAAVVRTAQARADISAEFSTYAAVDEWLADQALDVGEPGQVLLRRVIDASGRSRAFVNGTAATLGQLRALGDMLVDIHGQHAHQLLMRADAQRDLFDTHAGLVAVAADVGQTWRAWRAALVALESAQGRGRELELERERLAWQLSELDRVQPQPGEWEEVNQEHRRLSHAASLIGGVQSALELLTESDQSMLSQLNGMTSKLRELAEIDAGLNDTLAALEPAEIQLQEAAYSLGHYAQKLDLDPQRLAEVEARLEILHNAARKFRVPPETLPAEHAARTSELAALQAAADLNALQLSVDAAQRRYLEVAQNLSTRRAQAASALGRAVTTGMQELSMTGGRFEVALVQLAEGGAHGLEQVEFQVAGHSGVPLRPLSKVASGGELARISLALSVIASAASPTPTLIFDEVDSGIGGAVAEVVGRLLAQLGGLRQVLCVTHLPQVAARGQRHFKVAKAAVPMPSSASPSTAASADGLSTVSTVERLERQSRVEEIARMLGGVEITATTRKHAREMLST